MDTRLFIIAVTPAIVGLAAIYLADRVDREPLMLLLLTYLLGALSVIPIIVVEEILAFFNVFPGAWGAFYNAFIVAGATEEYFKRLVVVKLPFKTPYFNEKLDGIVYGVFAALGFATIENIVYVVFRYSYNPTVGFYRGIFSVPAHAIFGVTMGYYLSLAKFDTDASRKRTYHFKSWLMPTILHGAFNFILMADIPELTMLFVPYVIFLWWLNEKKLSNFVYDSRNRIKIRRKE